MKLNPEILTLFYTEDDLFDLVSELEDLASKLYKEDAKQFTEELQSTKVNIARAIFFDIQQSGISITDRGAVRNYLLALKETLLKIAKIEVTLAFFPSRNFLGKMAQWIRKELAEELAIVVKVDPEIVAGAKISYQGNYSDFSLSQQLQK